ncbi:MAG: hypothetical protein K2I26_00890, partial [Paramuribaculum sp.]|nr:hypothetical protein [Paramuribaculum sp.]
RMTMGVAALLASQSPLNPWDNALLRVALPGQTVPLRALTFSALPPAPDTPLTEPVIILAPAD